MKKTSQAFDEAQNQGPWRRELLQRGEVRLVPEKAAQPQQNEEHRPASEKVRTGEHPPRDGSKR